MLDFSKKIYERLKNMVIWGTFLILISMGISFAVFLIEKRSDDTKFTNIEELLWWWAKSVFGLGSEVDPVSSTAKFLSTLVFFSGFVLFGLFISEFSEIIRMIYARKEEGNIKIRHKNHVIIFGYTSLTAGIIKMLKVHFGSRLKIVLISNDVEFNPFPGQVDFIHDNPINEETMVDSNIKNATAAIILANDRFRDPDTYTLVIASAVERFNKEVITIVELVDDGYKSHLKGINIDAFISRAEMIKDLVNNNPDAKLKRIISKETVWEEKTDSSKVEYL